MGQEMGHPQRGVDWLDLFHQCVDSRTEFNPDGFFDKLFW